MVYLIIGLIVWYAIGIATILRVEWMTEDAISIRSTILALIFGTLGIITFLMVITSYNDLLKLGNWDVKLFKRKK